MNTSRNILIAAAITVGFAFAPVAENPVSDARRGAGAFSGGVPGAVKDFIEVFGVGTARAAMPRPADVTVHYDGAEQKCPEAAACADVSTSEIWFSGNGDPFSMSHEMGHIYLHRTLFNGWNDPKPERAAVMERLTRMLGYSAGTPWLGDDAYYDLDDTWLMIVKAPPDERAADAYAVCDLGTGPTVRHERFGGKLRRVKYSGQTTPYTYEPQGMRFHKRVCRVLRSLSK